MIARQITSTGVNVAFEKLSFSGWQQGRYGKRMLITAPASMLARIKAEAHRVGGTVHELNTTKLAMSQHCLCGSRAKKPFNQRQHHCDSCGLGPLDRDMFSGLLAQLVAKHAVTELTSGPFNGDQGIRGKAERLCVQATRSAPDMRRSGKTNPGVSGSLTNPVRMIQPTSNPGHRAGKGVRVSVTHDESTTSNPVQANYQVNLSKRDSPLLQNIRQQQRADRLIAIIEARNRMMTKRFHRLTVTP